MEQTIGKRIASLRKRKHMTQEQLAEQVGVSAQAVSKWENDLSCPDINLLPKLAEVFGVTTDNLLGMPEPQSPAPEQLGFHLNLGDDEDGEEDNNPNGLSFQWNFNKEDLPWFAVAVLLFAVSLLLNQTLLSALGSAGVWDLMWPSALLSWGIGGLWKKIDLCSAALTGFGGFFLLSNLHILPSFSFLNWQITLPVLLILWAVQMLLDHFRKGSQ